MASRETRDGESKDEPSPVAVNDGDQDEVSSNQPELEEGDNVGDEETSHGRSNDDFFPADVAQGAESETQSVPSSETTLTSDFEEEKEEIYEGDESSENLDDYSEQLDSLLNRMTASTQPTRPSAAFLSGLREVGDYVSGISGSDDEDPEDEEDLNEDKEGGELSIDSFEDDDDDDEQDYSADLSVADSDILSEEYSHEEEVGAINDDTDLEANIQGIGTVLAPPSLTFDDEQLKKILANARRHYTPTASLASGTDTDESMSLDDDGSDIELGPPAAAAAPHDKNKILDDQTRRALFWKKVDEEFKRKAQWVYLFFALYVLPVTLAIYLDLRYVSMLYFIGLGAISFVNGWMIFEAFASIYYTSKIRKMHRSEPKLIGERRLAALIAAYLPNELSVLIETVKAIGAQIKELPEGTTLDIVLTHNGGTKAQRITLLEDLRKIEKEIPDNVMVHELYVVRSRSKANNVNSGLAFLRDLSAERGKEFTQIAMYDADHQPISKAYRYALETMQDQGADMVMGRCCVFDGYEFIAVEFDILYAVAHAGGRMARGFGFFGGSNGYWDYKTLQETGMDETMLTEDVDSSFRAMAAGHRMTYDPTIVSYEESPPSLTALWKQRLRWAQGWAEVTVRQRTLWFRKAPGLTLWFRFCIFLLLPFRELYAYLSSHTVPIAIVFLFRSCGAACLDLRLLGMAIFCILVPPTMTIVAAKLTKDHVEGVHYRMPSLNVKSYCNYILICYIYELVKIHITVLGHARNVLGMTKWVVTKRRNTKKEEELNQPNIRLIERPESLVEESPFAPPVRRLFAKHFDSHERSDMKVFKKAH